MDNLKVEVANWQQNWADNRESILDNTDACQMQMDDASSLLEEAIELITNLTK